MSVIHGDCIEAMNAMEPESVDAVCTDPPYGLEFMGKEWDQFKDSRGRGVGASFGDMEFKDFGQMPNFGGRWMNKRCRLCGHIQSGGSPCRCPEPDWVREYEQGAPKHAVAYGAWSRAWSEAAYRVAKPSAYLLAFGGTRTVHRMTVALEDAGWIIRDMLVWAYASGFPKSKASLKPAWEPIVMARKPGPLRMLAIDECRIPTDGRPHIESKSEPSLHAYGDGLNGSRNLGETTLGRWPANVILTDPIFDGGVEGVVGGGFQQSQQTRTDPDGPGADSYIFGERPRGNDYLGDSGTYSRFFLLPKSARSDREPVWGSHIHEWVKRRYDDGVEDVRCDVCGLVRGSRANVHPTVKPTDLMRHLVRLVTPTGGTVLDPFLGSGTTALAAEMEGFEWIGIEREAEYVAIAEARLNGTQRGLGLETA